MCRFLPVPLQNRQKRYTSIFARPRAHVSRSSLKTFSIYFSKHSRHVMWCNTDENSVTADTVHSLRLRRYKRYRKSQTLYFYIYVIHKSSVAQWKGAGLITQRSVDRNHNRFNSAHKLGQKNGSTFIESLKFYFKFIAIGTNCLFTL